MGNRDRPRLLLGVTKSEIGGAQRHVLDLVHGLNPRWDVELVAGDEGWLTGQARRANCPVHIIDMDNGLGPVANLRAVQRLRSLARQVKPDLVHLHSSKMGFLGRLALQTEGVPTVFTAHGWAFGPAYGFVRRKAMAQMERKAAAWSSAIIVVSDADRRLAIAAGIPADLLTVVHNGVPDTVKATGPAPGRGKLRVGMLGRLAPPKDPLTLVRAVARLEGVELTLFGEGPLRAVAQAEADRVGVQLTVVPPPHDDPWRDVDVAVLASRSEGFPLVILEAMRAGLPVIASDVGGVREAVAEGETGFLVRAGDAEGLAQRIAQLRDGGLRRRLGTAGRRRFEREFRAEQMVEAIEGVYRRVLLARAPKPQSAEP